MAAGLLRRVSRVEGDSVPTAAGVPRVALVASRVEVVVADAALVGSVRGRACILQLISRGALGYDAAVSVLILLQGALNGE